MKVIETWILAALRNRRFFTFEELNKAIIEKLLELNEKPFQKRKGSRYTAFIEEEREFLMPLPASPYEMVRKLTFVLLKNVLKFSTITIVLRHM